MKIWIDAQLSPGLAPWVATSFGAEAHSLRDLNLRDAKDEEIFFAARAASAAVLTKDEDFVQLLEKNGSPPQILWLTTGNTSTQRLREVLGKHWTRIARLLGSGEPLIEIADDATL